MVTECNWYSSWKEIVDNWTKSNPRLIRNRLKSVRVDKVWKEMVVLCVGE